MDDQSSFQPSTSEPVPIDAFPEPQLVSPEELTADPPPAEFDPPLASAPFADPPELMAEPSVAASWRRVGAEVLSGVQTLFSAAVYATLIVTFCFQVARVDGLSMAPTLQDHDRLIVNKLVYELGEPRPGDIVMLYYPLNPEKMFV